MWRLQTAKMERISKWAPSRGFMVCMWFMIFVILSFTSTDLPKKKKNFYIDWDLEPATTKKGFLYILDSLNNPAKTEVHFFFYMVNWQWES